jgi:hypothetical protein
MGRLEGIAGSNLFWVEEDGAAGPGAQGPLWQHQAGVLIKGIVLTTGACGACRPQHSTAQHGTAQHDITLQIGTVYVYAVGRALVDFA